MGEFLGINCRGHSRPGGSAARPSDDECRDSRADAGGGGSGLSVRTLRQLKQSTGRLPFLRLQDGHIGFSPRFCMRLLNKVALPWRCNRTTRLPAPKPAPVLPPSTHHLHLLLPPPPPPPPPLLHRYSCPPRILLDPPTSPVMESFLGSPFGQMSPPDPPPPAPPTTQMVARHASRPVSAADSWSAQQSSLALRFYRLGLPGLAELVLSATKLDTSALMRDAASLEAMSSAPPLVITDGGASIREHAVSVHGGSGGGGGVSTPPETPSVSSSSSSTTPPPRFNSKHCAHSF